MRCLIVVGLFAPVFAAAPSRGFAQDTLPPSAGGLTASLGQPPKIQWSAGGSLGVNWSTPGHTVPVVLGSIGAFRSLTNPVRGLWSLSLELFGGTRGDQLDGGGRALLVIPSLRLSGGVEFSALTGRAAPLLGFTMPVRRGGIFGSGTLLRAEWTPSPGSAVRATVIAPIYQPTAGRTRALHSEVDLPVRGAEPPLPSAVIPELADALRHIRAAALRIEELVVPYIDAKGGDPRQALAPMLARLRSPPAGLAIQGNDGGLNIENTVRYYHNEMARAFSIAVSGQPQPEGRYTPQGLALAAIAKRDLLDFLLFPYDRLLGQRKTDETSGAFAVHARGNFARDLVTRTTLTREQDHAVQAVFQDLCETVETVRKTAQRSWGDSRIVWLPLQLGLLPEEYDTQIKFDSVLQRAVDHRFSDGNSILYLVNEQFQVEVTKSVLDARSYHVLWVHDFRGRNDQGQPDVTSLHYVVDAYLKALTQRAAAYDTTHTIPVYMIFLDQHYYEENRGRMWLGFLEDPLDSLPDLPEQFSSYVAQVKQAQRELVRAVQGSHLLQAEAAQYGSAWLRNVIKVQVNITNPADPSFWSPDIMPRIGIPDYIMRDHRKIAFYDVTEEDPYKGEAIYTGMGIGELYTGPTWEDRAIIVKGPAILTLKTEARLLLLQQGLSEFQIPYPLRPREKNELYEAEVLGAIAAQRSLGELDQRAMELHNRTGFQDKPIDVARAVLYSLMPPGSVVKAPDSIWGSSLYAALLCGSAFRGVRVLFIAPTITTGPNLPWPVVTMTHDLFARLIVLQQELGLELEAVGGMLKTGLYNPGVGVEDLFRRLRAAYQNGRRTPFLRQLYPLAQAVDSLLARLPDSTPPQLVQESLQPDHPEQILKPKLHLKATFFASREGWDSLVSRPEFANVLRAYFAQVLGGADARARAERLRLASRELVDSFRAHLPEESRKRVIYFLVIGSANQNYRSMFMDGEASVVLADWSGVASLIDMSLIANLSVWVDDLPALDDLLPPPSGFQRAVARWIRPML